MSAQSTLETATVAETTGAATDIASIPGLRELWAHTLGEPQICIAVLDGPVNLAHPSLVGASLTQLDVDGMLPAKSRINSLRVCPI